MGSQSISSEDDRARRLVRLKESKSFARGEKVIKLLRQERTIVVILNMFELARLRD